MAEQPMSMQQSTMEKYQYAQQRKSHADTPHNTTEPLPCGWPGNDGDAQQSNNLLSKIIKDLLKVLGL